MKTTLFLAAATVGLLTVVNTVSAADPSYSPRAKAQADSLRTVPAVCCDDVDLTKNLPRGNARAWELANSFRTVVSSGPSVDLVHGPRPLLSPKDPRYEAALRQLRDREFQVAPLK